MNIDFITFSKRGAGVAISMQQYLKKNACYSRVFSFYKKSIGSSIPFDDLTQQTEQSFREADSVVFVSSCEVAVRASAPFLQLKADEPDVIVLDEEMKHIIPLISGKYAKAEKLAEIISNATGAECIFTKSEEVNSYFGLENFVKKNNLIYDNKKFYREMISEMATRDKVGFRTYFSHSVIPDGLTEKNSYPMPETGICVTYTKLNPPYKRTLFLFPKCLTLGISVKAGTSFQTIENHVMKLLTDYRIPLTAIENISTLVSKKNEEGLQKFCEEYHLPAFYYEPKEIANVQGELLDKNFISKKIIIESVCERCALIKSRGKLVTKRMTDDGVAIVLAVKNIFLEM